MRDPVDELFERLLQQCGDPDPLFNEAGTLIRNVTEHLQSFGCTELLSFGSSAAGTALEGESDQDFLAVFPVEMLSHNPGMADDIMSIIMARLFGEGTVDGFPSPPAFVVWSKARPDIRIDIIPGVKSDFLFDANQPQRSALEKYAFPDVNGHWEGINPEFRVSIFSFAGTEAVPLIRLLKLWKYRRQVPVRPYFLENFVLRWMESSLEFDFDNAPQIVDALQSLQRRGLYSTPAVEKYGSAIGLLLNALRDFLRSDRFPDDMPRLASLGSPAFGAWAYPCATREELERIRSEAQAAAETASEAMRLADQAEFEIAVSRWDTLYNRKANEIA